MYYGQGKYNEAAAMYKKALAIYIKTVGEEHPSVANTYWNMALLSERLNKPEEARPLYERALGIKRVVFGPDHKECKKVEKALAALNARVTSTASTAAASTTEDGCAWCVLQ